MFGIKKYRILEMIPGLLVWLTFIAVITLSVVKPLWAIYFIIAFDAYWVLRLDFFERFIKYMEWALAEKTDAVFILNRFHISYRLYSDMNVDLQKRYDLLLRALQQMNVLVLVPIVSEEMIEERASHKERIDPAWKLHLQKRLTQRGFLTLREMYAAEQLKIKQLLEEQKIPYQLLDTIDL